MRIVALAAVTIDGKIALHSSHFSDWTSPEDKVFLKEFLDASDCVVVGNNTYKTAEDRLSKRNCIVFTSSVESSERKRDNLLFCNPAVADIVELLREYKTITVLGGTKTYTYFLEKDLLDEIYLTIEPITFGTGLNLFETNLDAKKLFRLESVKQLNDTGSILLHYVRR